MSLALVSFAFLAAFMSCALIRAEAQTTRKASTTRTARTPSQTSNEEFGPVVRSYLDYLRDEQKVTDDRISQREISRAYYLRNSHRIRALRQIALQIARSSKNDYMPELEAVAPDEMRRFFETPPKPDDLRPGAIINNTFRFLATVRAAEPFYIFERLDAYEQADLMKKSAHAAASAPNAARKRTADSDAQTSGAKENRQERK